MTSPAKKAPRGQVRETADGRVLEVSIEGGRIVRRHAVPGGDPAPGASASPSPTKPKRARAGK